jgi:hypothetical protein
MDNFVEYYDLPWNMRTVDIKHKLTDGTVLYGKEQYEKHVGRFTWVDLNFIVRFRMWLQHQTHSSLKSVIMIYETGVIEYYLNVPKSLFRQNPSSR